MPVARLSGSSCGHGAAITLAESICGTANRIDSPRVPGSRHCVERDVAAADSAKLFSLLRKVAHGFSLGERRPGAESRRKTGKRSYRCHSSFGRPAPSIRTAGCLGGPRDIIFGTSRALASTPPGAEFSSQKQTFSSTGRPFGAMNGLGEFHFRPLSVPVI